MTDLAKKARQSMGDRMLFQRAAAYILSGNGVHIWEAYRDCRKIGREPPPWVANVLASPTLPIGYPVLGHHLH